MDKAGIREVAKAAGVSISTVSRAFTRPELVSERTRRKVLETADKLDFNISRSATSLKSGQTYRVALLMNEEITSWFNTEVFAGINAVMHEAGYDISLFQHIDTAENRRDFFTNLPVRRNVDAVFVASSRRKSSSSSGSMCRSSVSILPPRPVLTQASVSMTRPVCSPPHSI